MIIILNTLSSHMLKPQQSRGRVIIQAYNGQWSCTTQQSYQMVTHTH